MQIIQKRATVPWWAISIICGLVACCLLALAILLPYQYSWMFLGLFVLTTFAVIVSNPLYYYRRVATYLLGAWISITAIAGLKASLLVPQLGYFSILIESVGLTFHIVVGLVLCILLFLDYQRTKSVWSEVKERAQEIDSAESEEARIKLLSQFEQSDRGKIVLQELQSRKQFFSIDTSLLDRKDAAKIALQQIESRSREIISDERRSLIRLAICLVITVILILFILVPVIRHFFEPRHLPVSINFSFPDDEVKPKLKALFHYGIHEQEKEITDRQMLLAVGSDVSDIDDIKVLDPRYEIEEKGPYKIVQNRPIKLTVIRVLEPPPLTPPSESIFSKPSKEVVLGENPKVPSSSVSLGCKNSSDRDLHLFIFDLYSHYTNSESKWTGLSFPRSNQFESVVNFPSSGTGWFCVIVRDLSTGADHPLGCFSLYRRAENTLIVNGVDGRFGVSPESSLEK